MQVRPRRSVKHPDAVTDFDKDDPEDCVSASNSSSDEDTSILA